MWSAVKVPLLKASISAMFSSLKVRPVAASGSADTPETANAMAAYIAMALRLVRECMAAVFGPDVGMSTG